jgi:hypothetical protein
VALAAIGTTEVILDVNMSPPVAGAGSGTVVDHDAALAHADHVLTTFAPRVTS